MLTYTQLLVQNTQLRAEKAMLIAQRDALLDEIRGMCDLCKHYHNGDGDEVCRNCCFLDSAWLWRGAKEDT